VNEITLISVISLASLGIIASVVLYMVAQKFKVVEDPRIDLVAEKLPGANCGGCGYAGCRALAEQIVRTESFEGVNCPPGGNEAIAEIASVLGLEATQQEPTIAVIRCSGSHENAPRKNIYQGAASCAFVHSLYAGESGCPNGCLGCGDCVRSCDFDAMYMDENTGLPVVKDNCVSCGACVKACPRNIIEIRKRGKKDRRIYVSCINQEKGALARKNCQVACIGCQKCVKECKFEAIIFANNLAYIDYNKCTLCRKCPPVCPTNAIHELNFPVKKQKAQADSNLTEA
jgi:Na+-translocating ferredoxin:NAD+ oxidoreductase subunit B